MQSIHKPVLLQETIDGLNLSPESGKKIILIDATFGGGGHCKEICKKYPGVKILALDEDESALQRAKKTFTKLNCEIIFTNENFRNIDRVVERQGIKDVSGIIFDLGLSSDQLENSGRGFSFMKDEPLLMTMKENPGRGDVTAADAVNTWSEKNLADVIFGYGEERYARRIAKGIVERRGKKRIETSFELVDVIRNSVPGAYRRGKLHFATRTFQAIRIAVNDELGALKEGLAKGFEMLESGGRMSVISFHSLEDRIVKNFYKAKNNEGKAKLINKKVIRAGDGEIKNNNRARSAKLRILEKK